MEGQFCIFLAFSFLKTYTSKLEDKNLKLLMRNLKLNLKYELIFENFKLILGNWIWFWETWSWYLGSIWNLSHGTLLSHGCIMVEFFGIQFLESLTIFLKTWIYILEKWTCISWYWILKSCILYLIIWTCSWTWILKFNKFNK
jgi:hypothetical protein